MKNLMMAIMTCAMLSSVFANRVEVKSRDYTCSQLKDLLADNGSIWIKSPILPFLAKNIALNKPVCNGSARSHPRRTCRYYTGGTWAKDGRCRLGRECTCRAPVDNDD